MAAITRNVSNATINGTASADLITVTGLGDKVFGLGGNDVIKITAERDDVSPVKTWVDAGAGADTINARAVLFDGNADGTRAENSLVGGLGNDKITAYASASGGGDGFTAFNNISGGGGANVLSGSAYASGDGGVFSALNTIKGGELGDTITATANVGTLASSRASNDLYGFGGESHHRHRVLRW